MTTKMTTNFVQLAGVLALTWLVGQTLSDCDVCQTNQAACINSTSYYLCFGDGVPHTDYLYTCLDGFQCSDKTAICIQKSAQRPPSCGDTSKCGMCSAQRNYKFACLSRGIFQMCYGASQPTGPYGDCPEGTVCDATTDTICVAETPGQTLTCDINDALVRTTVAPPPANTTESSTNTPTDSSTDTSPVTEPPPLTAQQLCLQMAKSGLYETVPRDTTCKRYISCYYSKGTAKATEYDCAATAYFDAVAQSCVYIKPSNCV